jgi:hypothetical protein
MLTFSVTVWIAPIKRSTVSLFCGTSTGRAPNACTRLPQKSWSPKFDGKTAVGLPAQPLRGGTCPAMVNHRGHPREQPVVGRPLDLDDIRTHPGAFYRGEYLVEDEWGLLQATVFRPVYEQFGAILHHEGAFLLDRKVEQTTDNGFSFILYRVKSLRKVLTSNGAPTSKAAPSSGTFLLARRRGRRAG